MLASEIIERADSGWYVVDDDDLRATVQGLEGTYIQPLLETGLATTAMLLKAELLRLHLAQAQRSLAALAR